MYLTVLAIFLLLFTGFLGRTSPFVIYTCGAIAFVDFIYEYRNAHKTLKGLNDFLSQRLSESVRAERARREEDKQAQEEQIAS